jgi:hypothetical protein
MERQSKRKKDMANPFAKTRDVDNPYAIYKGYIDGIGEIEIRVLRRYKHSVKSEKLNRYSRWFTAAKSNATSVAGSTVTSMLMVMSGTEAMGLVTMS